jgi:hypothetical protein
MTRAERWGRKSREAQARQPRIQFEGIEAYAVNFVGDLRLQSLSGLGVTISAKRIPALTKFLREYFVRRDK